MFSGMLKPTSKVQAWDEMLGADWGQSTDSDVSVLSSWSPENMAKIRTIWILRPWVKNYLEERVCVQTHELSLGSITESGGVDVGEIVSWNVKLLFIE